MLEYARDDGRVLITEDKEFGELVFLRGLPHGCVVRLVDMSPRAKLAAMRNLIEGYEHAMRDGAIIVVTEQRARIRSTQATEGKDGE